MTLITKNPIKIVLIIILLLLGYNIYSNNHGHPISYGLILLGIYLIFNDSLFEGMVNTTYENKDIDSLLDLDITKLFNSSDEPLSKDEIEQKVTEQVEEVTKSKLSHEGLTKEAEQLIEKDDFIKNDTEKLIEKGMSKEEANEKAQSNYNNAIIDETKLLETKYKKALEEAKTKLIKEANKEQDKKFKNKKEMASKVNKLRDSRNNLVSNNKVFTLDEQREMAKKLFSGTDENEDEDDEDNEDDEDDEENKLIKELQTSKKNKMIKTGLINETDQVGTCDASISKALAPLQSEISKLREKTSIPPDVKKAKIKNFTLLAEMLIEKEALSEEEYESMKTKLDSNVLTLDDAIGALEKFKRASKSIKKNKVSGKKDKWWSDMNKSELPMDMYIPKGEHIDNKWSNEFTILNTDKWTVPMARPPVCIDSTPKDIMPMGTSGYPMHLKYYDQARYVSTSAKMEKAKHELENDNKPADDIKEKFTNWI